MLHSHFPPRLSLSLLNFLPLSATSSVPPSMSLVALMTRLPFDVGSKCHEHSNSCAETRARTRTRTRLVHVMSCWVKWETVTWDTEMDNSSRLSRARLWEICWSRSSGHVHNKVNGWSASRSHITHIGVRPVVSAFATARVFLNSSGSSDHFRRLPFRTAWSFCSASLTHTEGWFWSH